MIGPAQPLEEKLEIAELVESLARAAKSFAEAGFSDAASAATTKAKRLLSGIFAA